MSVVTEENPECRVCHSKDVTTCGQHLDHRDQKIYQRYKCRKCGTTFTAGKYRFQKKPLGGRDFFMDIMTRLAERPSTPGELCAALDLNYQKEVYPTLKTLLASSYVEAHKKEGSCPTCGRRMTGNVYRLLPRGITLVAAIKRKKK